MSYVYPSLGRGGGGPLDPPRHNSTLCRRLWNSALLLFAISRIQRAYHWNLTIPIMLAASGVQDKNESPTLLFEVAPMRRVDEK